MKITGKEHAHRFIESRKKEWEGLQKNETFKILKRSQVPSGARINGLRFIDAEKTVDGKSFKKSRLA